MESEPINHTIFQFISKLRNKYSSLVPDEEPITVEVDDDIEIKDTFKEELEQRLKQIRERQDHLINEQS